MDLTTNPNVAIISRADGSTYALPRFVWDVNREQAAVDIAEGQLSLTLIARRACTHPGALKAWREHPEFAERVEQARKVFREQALSFGLARKEARMMGYQERHDLLREIVHARGRAFEEDPRLAGIAGGSTGYVYEHMTSQGPEYLIDVKTIAMQNELAKQAAIEQGEWNEGSGASVAVQIVCPASAPPASAAPTVTIGTR